MPYVCVYCIRARKGKTLQEKQNPLATSYRNSSCSAVIVIVVVVVLLVVVVVVFKISLGT